MSVLEQRRYDSVTKALPRTTPDNSRFSLATTGTRWFQSRGLVCLLAAALATLPEWSAIWYRYAPTGADALIGYTWRALLLGLLPVAGYLVFEVTAAAAFSMLAPAAWIQRVERVFSKRLAWSLIYALAFSLIACLVWILVISSWKDFDFPFHVPWIEWERRFRSLAVEMPRLAVAAAVLGAGVGWIRYGSRKSPTLPPILTRGAPVAFVVGGVLALETARRPLGLFGSFAPITRPLAFLVFVAGLTLWFLNRKIDLPRAVAALGWTAVLGGAIGGGGLLLTRLAGPDPAVLALVDANRSVASKVWVRLAGSNASPIQLACTAEAPPHVPDTGHPVRDVVLITVDALHGGHLSSNGYGEETTPRIDSLASGGIRFTNALTTSSSTKLALPALAFSRPYECFDGTAEGLTGLFDVLRDAGYQTGLVSGYDLEVGVTSEYAPALLGAFQRTDFSPAGSFVTDTHPVDHEVAEKAQDLIREFDSSQPMALWVHFYDPHSVYNPTRAQASRFGSGRRARYDAEVYETDAAIGRVLDALRGSRSDWNPIVIVTADHGESVEEVGARAHGYTLIHAVLRVPLVIAAEGIAQSTVHRPVSLLDVAPTVLALAGYAPPPSFMGVSLLPLARGETDNWRPVRIARPQDDGVGTVDQRVFYQGYKLVHKVRPRQALLYGTSDIYELYEPESDPAERRNLIDVRPRVAESLMPYLPYKVWNGEVVETSDQGGGP